MTVNYEEGLTYEIPDNWCLEDTEDALFIYNPDGDGAVTVSFYNVLEMKETLDEHISIMAKKFIDRNQIILHAPLILHGNKDTKTTLYGEGTTSDNWFIKLWIVTKYPKIIFATYQCEKKTSELKICDAIIDSIKFSGNIGDGSVSYSVP